MVLSQSRVLKCGGKDMEAWAWLSEAQAPLSKATL